MRRSLRAQLPSGTLCAVVALSPLTLSRSAHLSPLGRFALRVLCVALLLSLSLAAASCRETPLSSATLLALLAAALFASTRATVEESFLILPGVGLRVEARLNGGGVQWRFVPQERVAAVVINEAVSTTSVYFYLAVALHGDSKLLLPFPAFRPRLAQLVPVYQEAMATFPPSRSAASWPSMQRA